MMLSRTCPFALMPLLALTGACAATGAEYPSLAIRDVERTQGQLAAPAIPPAPAPPRATLERLGPLAAEARAAHAAFLAAAASTREQVARAGASGSDSWAQAQVTLADLRSRRSTAMVALADLDRLYIDALVAGESAEAIAPVRSEVDAMLAEQDRVLDSLIGQLAR